MTRGSSPAFGFGSSRERAFGRSHPLKQIVFVRHGESEWNATSRMQGQLESDLTARGREQTEVNARVLANLGIEELYSSPLGRARESAAIINRQLSLPIRCDSRIKEWDCGDWSGELYEDVQTKWADQWAAYQADRFHYRGPNCENYPDMIARVQPFLDELLRSAARSIAVVSHGMIGRVMVSTLLGYDEPAMLGFHQPNDVLYRVMLGKAVATVEHYVAGAGPFPGVIPRAVRPE
jgi:probable phosphoglycerate mutase